MARDVEEEKHIVVSRLREGV